MKHRGYLFYAGLILTVLYMASVIIPLVLVSPADGYAEVLSNPLFSRSLANTAVLVLLLFVPVSVLAFFIAYIGRRMKHSLILYAVLLLPFLIPTVSAAAVWQKIVPIYSSVDSLIPLGDDSAALLSFCVLYLWKYLGVYVLINRVSLDSVPDVFFEEATVCGAKNGDIIGHIIIPMLVPTFVFEAFITVFFYFGTVNDSFVLFGRYPPSSVFGIAQYLSNTIDVGGVNIALVSTQVYVLAFVLIMLMSLLIRRKAAKNET